MYTERVCNPSYKGFSETTERIIKYDPDQYQFTYQIVQGLPKMVTYATNEWTHEVSGQGTQMTMHVTMRVRGIMGWLMKGVMQKKMGNILQEALEELKVYAETGKLHPRKKAAKEKYQREQQKKSRKTATKAIITILLAATNMATFSCQDSRGSSSTKQLNERPTSEGRSAPCHSLSQTVGPRTAWILDASLSLRDRSDSTLSEVFRKRSDELSVVL